MPGETFNAKATLEADVGRYVAGIKQASDVTQKLGAAGLITAKQQNQLEKSHAQGTRAITSLTGATNQAALAQNRAAIATKGSTNNLISQRYALYDVSRTFLAVSTAILGTAAISAKLAIDYQRDFAAVQRTTGVTGDAIGQLKTKLVDLTTVIPTSFKDISGIAALGGQLGIASGGIDDFTSVVARLTATTNLSSEAAGTALGRFQALLGTPSSEFENLGSSILKVGINSVATETEIVNIATQISSMGDFAGMTADQVVGLSGALASVGGKAELSRGTVTRTFTLMSKAVAEGGDKLQNFAAISGVSASEFAQAWGTENFAAVFQQFLSGLDAEGGNAIATLNELGITSVRDVPLLMRLAGAGDVVQQAFADAATGYSDATELGSQFAIIAETISAKLTDLGNTLKGVIATVGEGGFGPLTMMLDVVQQLASALLAFSRNPIGKFFLGAAAGAAVFVGVVALIKGTSALAGASLMAMKTAQDSLTGAAARSSAVVKELAVTMVNMARGNAGAAASTAAVTTGLTWQTSATETATVATRTLGATMKSVMISTGIGAAILGIAWAVEKLSTTFQSADAKANAYFGDISGLSEAIKEDTAAYDTAVADAERLGKTFDESAAGFTTFVSGTGEATATLNPFGEALATASDAQITLNENTSDTTDKIVEQTAAIGDAARAVLAAALANSPDFQAAWLANGDAIESAGLDLQTFMDMTVADPQGAVTYLDELIAKYNEMAVAEGQAHDAAILMNDGSAERASDARLDTIQKTIVGFTDLKDAALGMAGEIATAIASNDIFSGLMGDAGAGLDDGTDAAEGFDNALKDLLTTEYELTGNTVSVQSALSSLGASLYENGNTFSEYSAGGQANLAALQSTLSAMVTAAGGDNVRLATMVAGLMQQMTAMGYGAVNELSFVQSFLAQITGGKGTGGLLGVGLAAQTAGVGLGQGFAGGAKKATKAAKSTAKEIRTLTDYIKDLSGVFSDAFDIRFGLDQSLDSVADSYQGLIDYSDDAAQAVRDAAQSIAEADAKIRGLTAANTTLEYQLTVAREYGDVLRANEIIAEMAANNADLTKEQDDRTDSQKDLSKAQDAASKSLSGGTDASREQRSQVLDLLSAYQDQITALANTGLSQAALAQKTAELKQRFMDQLRQLGYNEAEVQRYAQSFDDLTYAISRVPRNLTISANTNPAIRAIDEYTAHLRTAQEAASALGSTNMTPAIDDAKMRKAARGYELLASIDRITALMLATSNYNAKSAMESQIRTLTAVFNSGNYWAGGFTGRGGKYQPKGIVHGGEYVIPKEDVNQSTGLPYSNALNNIGATTYHSTSNNYYGGGSVPTTNGIQLVEILPTQVQQIADALYVMVTLDGRELTSAVNRTNSGSVKRGSN